MWVCRVGTPCCPHLSYSSTHPSTFLKYLVCTGWHPGSRCVQSLFALGPCSSALPSYHYNVGPGMPCAPALPSAACACVRHAYAPLPAILS